MSTKLEKDALEVSEVILISRTYLESNAVVQDLTLMTITDYECCGVCGFDHGYEPAEAAAVHEETDRHDFDIPERF